MLVVISVYIVIVLWDIGSLLKNKDRIKMMIAYFVFIIAGLTVGILLFAGRRPASPADVIEQFLSGIGVGNEG